MPGIASRRCRWGINLSAGAEELISRFAELSSDLARKKFIAEGSLRGLLRLRGQSRPKTGTYGDVGVNHARRGFSPSFQISQPNAHKYNLEGHALTLECVFSPLSRSVPSFHGLQEDILSKLADVLEEVNAPASRTAARRSAHFHTATVFYRAEGRMSRGGN